MVVTRELTAADYDATDVAHHDMGSASDLDIAALAASQGAAVVSADRDFATLLAVSGDTAPSLILLRSADALSPDEQAALLIANLPAVADEVAAGAVASLSETTSAGATFATQVDLTSAREPPTRGHFGSGVSS